MALTKENIQQLVALQQNDSVLDRLQKEMDRIPKEIEALRAGLEGAKGKVSQAKSSIQTLEKKKKEKELELAAKEEGIRKHGMELNQVKTNEAFKALQAEIDAGKAACGGIETEILECMEGIDAGRKAEKAAAAELKDAESKTQGEVAVLEKELAEFKAKHDAQKAQREQAAAGVPAQMMRIYNHARGRGKLDAIVPIDGENCSACRINLSPQMVIEATKGTSLVVCESCQRILYKAAPAVKAA